jgi:carboxylesterase
VKRLRWILIALAALVTCWLIGDFAYSRVVLHRYQAWERSIERDADGVRVGCEAFTVGEGETAILFVHGYSDSPAMFRKIAPRLAEMGFTCRAMLRPGCARPMELYAEANREKWKEAIAIEVAALRKEYGRVFVAGHSLGGALAIDYAMVNPDGADGIILIAPLIEVSAERSPILPARTWYKLGKKLLLFTNIIENPFSVNAHSAEAQAYDMYSRFYPRELYDEIFEITDDIAGGAGELTLPMLMVLARNDDIVDSEAARAYYEESYSRRKKLLWMEDAGHMIPIDTGWEEVAAAIAEFAAPAAGASE